MILTIEEKIMKVLMEMLKKEIEDKNKEGIVQCYNIAEKLNLEQLNTEILEEYSVLMSQGNDVLYK
jgi:hypothetical protein